MVVQYPHIITVTPAGTPEQGEGGDFEAPEAGAPVSYPCRVEDAGGNPVINMPDGQSLTYRFTVYMALIGVVYNFGDAVAILKQDGSLFTGTIKQQSNGQFNTRLWV